MIVLNKALLTQVIASEALVGRQRAKTDVEIIAPDVELTELVRLPRHDSNESWRRNGKRKGRR